MNMPPASHLAAVVRAVDVCPCRLTGTKTEFLLLKRAPDVVYAGT